MKPYNVMLHVVNEIVNDSAIVPTATSVTTLSNTSSVATSSNTSASPPLYEGVFKQ